METYPKVKAVQALANKRLRVTFRNDQVKVYDCTFLLDQPAFRLLHDEAFFQSVASDPYGYGVAWSDDVDLAESELWLNGAPESAAVTRLRDQ